MHETMAMREVERARNLAGESHGFLDRELVLAVDSGAQRLAEHERHHVVEQSLRGAGVVYRKNVRMREPGGDLDLTLEALAAHGRGQLRIEDLDRDVAVDLQVARAEHDCHPAASDFANEGIACVQRGLET